MIFHSIAHKTRSKPVYELAQIFHRYLNQYIQNHNLSFHEKKVVRAIQNCRTDKLGGHIARCSNPTCDYETNAYNSCGNRHCPKCQLTKKLKWIYQRLVELLPLPYYHVVFTLPHIINNLALHNKKLIYDLFFQASSMTLHDFSRDEKLLGAQLGFIGILHTWSQTLAYHIHLHYIVAGGGLSYACRCFKRLPYQKKFLFPVIAMSKRMRKHFCDLFDKAYRSGRLRFPGKLSMLQPPSHFDLFQRCLSDENFVIYSKKPFAGPETVVEYFGNYTHRVAISNYRLMNIDHNQVTFRYRDRRDKDKKGRAKIKEMVLPSDTFIGRFLFHILPVNFRKIRYYGFLSLGQRTGKLQQARKLLEDITERTIQSLRGVKDWLDRFESFLFRTCPSCKNGTLMYRMVPIINSS